MAPTKTEPEHMTSTTLSWLIGSGFLLQFAGGFCLGVALSAGDGQVLLLVPGWLFVGVGSALMLVGLIGWAVLLGLRAHTETS